MFGITIPIELVVGLSVVFVTFGKQLQEYIWDGVQEYLQESDQNYIWEGFLNNFKWRIWAILLFVFSLLYFKGYDGLILILVFVMSGALFRGNKWIYTVFSGVFDFLEPIKDNLSTKALGLVRPSKEEKEEKETTLT